jgi:hypothetical protein
LVGAAVLLCAARKLSADELIQIPTADRVTGPTGAYRQRVSDRSEGYGTVLAPIGPMFELMGRYYNRLDRSHNLEAGGQFQLFPDGVVTPAISVGMWDVGNNSPWGRRAFLMISKTLTPYGPLVSLPSFFERIQLSLGTGTGRFSGALAGARIDLPARFSLVTEYDSRRLNTGIWFRPVKPLAFKGELQNGNPYVGAEFRASF